MDDPTTFSALYWLSWLDPIKTWAEAGVVFSLGVGLIAGIVAAPLTKAVQAARELQVAKLKNDAEALRRQNLELERAVSPRVLEQSLTAAALSRFAGVQFVVISPQDFEPKRTAGQIRYVLQQAKWAGFTEPLRMPFPFVDGVVVHVMGRISKKNDPAAEAANALISVLNENGIQSRVGYPTPFFDEHGKPIPPIPSPTERPNVLIVEVGPKPLPTSLQLSPDKIPADAKGNKSWGNMAE